MILTFKKAAEKKHSVRFNCEEPKMSIYIPCGVLLDIKNESGLQPVELKLTFEAQK